MNKILSSLILFGMLFNLSFNQKEDLYQVMSSHPHDVKEFSPYIKTVSQQGRLWLVELKENTPKNVMKHFRKTDGSDVKSYRPSFTGMQKGSQRDFSIQELTSKVDITLIKSDVEMLSNFKTRAVGTDDNRAAGETIKEAFINMGYSVSEQCYREGACSIIADKPGTGSGVIMLMAHFDSVGKKFAGADDNASGTAVMLEVARILKSYSNNQTIRFFATNGEESGLLGAEHYAKVLRESGEIKKIKLAINMDMVGYNSNGIVELETNKEYEALALWFSKLAAEYTSLTTKITLGAWGSDHVPFLKSGVDTLLTIEDWSTKTPCYHMECDKPETLNYEYAGEIAKLNMAAILKKDKEIKQ